MNYTPRSVPLPIPVPHNQAMDESGAKILNLLSICANCVEEYHSPQRPFLQDPTCIGNLQEFEGCLISAMMHWLFIFEAESLLSEEVKQAMRDVLKQNEHYKKKCNSITVWKDGTYKIWSSLDAEYALAADRANILVNIPANL